MIKNIRVLRNFAHFRNQPKIYAFSKPFYFMPIHHFSALKPKVFEPIFDKMFSMKEEGSYEIEEYEQQFIEIQKLLQGEIQPSDLADALLAIQEFVRSSGKMQKSLLNQMILVHNDIFDTFSRKK